MAKTWAFPTEKVMKIASKLTENVTWRDEMGNEMGSRESL